MDGQTVKVIDGSTFFVSDANGDITARAGEAEGLFYRDVRHLSDWRLTMNGRSLDVLSSRNIEYDEVGFWLVVHTGTIHSSPEVTVSRQRQLRTGLQEQLTVSNHGSSPVRLELSVLFDADFADLLEVKEHLPKEGRVTRAVDDDSVVLAYRHQDFRRATRVRAPGAHCTAGSLTYRFELAPHASSDHRIEVELVDGDGNPARRRRAGRPNMEQDLHDWIDNAPRLESDWDELRHIYRQSLVDLAALRFYPPGLGGSSLPAAGLPWFMALFGRDAIITSFQALPCVPELARTTLRALAARQATEVDDFRDAEPGKILHELRHGELVHFRKRPQSPYYGSADSTLLFLILLSEYERWTGDGNTIAELERAARAAVAWMEDDGDLDGDGYIEYRTRNPTSGLDNQCWKDSWNSIVHPDGTLAALPRATCELQGYAYDARLRTAALARTYWHDDALADRLEAEAAQLRSRFNRDFWVDDGFFALALDGEKAQVATKASNMGHLLWSGIVDERHAPQVVQQLLGPELFSGWGVRTVAADHPVYNPVGYHIGTVWPHDTALIALGLRRYGYLKEATALATAILEAARFFGYRLPEAFAGFTRGETTFPVEYPSACSPQAWATGAPLMLLRVLLGLEPTESGLGVDPLLPAGVGRIRLTGVPGRWGAADASADRSGS